MWHKNVKDAVKNDEHNILSTILYPDDLRRLPLESLPQVCDELRQLLIKEVSGKTAARWIDEAVILEAKTMLRYSEMSIQEIANALNFSTQSFFGKYFKQHTGVSPSRYKHK